MGPNKLVILESVGEMDPESKVYHVLRRLRSFFGLTLKYNAQFLGLSLLGYSWSICVFSILDLFI